MPRRARQRRPSRRPRRWRPRRPSRPGQPSIAQQPAGVPTLTGGHYDRAGRGRPGRRGRGLEGAAWWLVGLIGLVCLGVGFALGVLGEQGERMNGSARVRALLAVTCAAGALGAPRPTLGDPPAEPPAVPVVDSARRRALAGPLQGARQAPRRRPRPQETLVAGHYLGIVLPIYLPDQARPEGPQIEDASAVLATIEAIIAANPVLLLLGAARAEAGKISTFLSIEGAGAFAGGHRADRPLHRARRAAHQPEPREEHAALVVRDRRAGGARADRARQAVLRARLRPGRPDRRLAHLGRRVRRISSRSPRRTARRSSRPTRTRARWRTGRAT